MRACAHTLLHLMHNAMPGASRTSDGHREPLTYLRRGVCGGRHDDHPESDGRDPLCEVHPDECGSRRVARSGADRDRLEQRGAREELVLHLNGCGDVPRDDIQQRNG